MKKKFLFVLSSILLSGSLQAQNLSNGGFNGPIGVIGSSSAGVPWSPGCAYNNALNFNWNSPEVKQVNGDNYVELKGNYTAYQGNPSIYMESVAQDVGPLAAGKYTITFDARNYLQTTGNPGLQLMVTLKNYTSCSYDPINQNQTTEELNEYVSIPLVQNFNTYSISFCIPQNLNNELSILEFAAMHQFDNTVSCNGIIDLDNISIASTPPQYDLAYDYEIDCLTGQVRVRPTGPLNPNLYDSFVLFENNPNDPNNQSTNGDIIHDQIFSWSYAPDAQGWLTIPLALERGKNYYLKRGIWGDCLSWKELRKYNLELVPDNFDASFTFEINCNDQLQPILSVTGADQFGKNPHHMFTLYKYFPGTSNPDQVIEHVGWMEQSNVNNYQYQQGPFTFNHVLDPNAHYYVKRGTWDACTPWQETRRYDINPVPCDPNGICNIDIYQVPQLSCRKGCALGSTMSVFQVDQNSTCYNVIDYVEFTRYNGNLYGSYHVDYQAPFTLSYCTDSYYYITATIHYLNGTTSSTTHFEPPCSGWKSLDNENDFEEGLSEIKLYPNPVSDVLNVESTLDYDNLNIYSMDGKLVGTYTSNSIEVVDLVRGYYLMEVVKDGSVVAMERFIKK